MLLKPVAISLVKVFCLCPVAGIFLVTRTCPFRIRGFKHSNHPPPKYQLIIYLCSLQWYVANKGEILLGFKLWWGIQHILGNAWSYPSTNPSTSQYGPILQYQIIKRPQISSHGHLVVASLFIDKKTQPLRSLWHTNPRCCFSLLSKNSSVPPFQPNPKCPMFHSSQDGIVRFDKSLVLSSFVFAKETTENRIPPNMFST